MNGELGFWCLIDIVFVVYLLRTSERKAQNRKKRETNRRWATCDEQSSKNGKMASTKKTTKHRLKRKQLPRRDIDSGHNNKNALSIADLSSAWDTEFVPRSYHVHAISHIILFSIRSTLSCLDIFLTALFVFLFILFHYFYTLIILRCYFYLLLLSLYRVYVGIFLSVR